MPLQAISGEIRSQMLNDNFSYLDSEKLGKGNLPYFNVKDFGALGNGIQDDAPIIQSVLDKALQFPAGINIVIPPGTYALKSELHVKRNTYLKMHHNTILLRQHNDNVMTNYAKTGDDIWTGYTGHGNIIIEGGIFDCNGANYFDVGNGIGFAHADGIVMRDSTIKDTAQGHAMELTGCQNVLIDNMKFLGFKDNDTNEHYYSEAIQIEPTLPAPVGGGYTYAYNTDYTTTRNVTVQNCYFGASSTPGFGAHPTGVGAHGAAHDIFYDNIIIRNNHFAGQSYYAIRPYKFRHTIITDNIIENGNGGGIYAVVPTGGASITDRYGVVQTPQSLTDFIIANNTIRNMGGKGIYVTGDSVAYISKMNCRGNVIDNITGYAIHLEYVNYCIFAENILENITGRAFFCNFALHSRFVENMVKRCYDSAIFLTNCNYADFVGNTVNEINYYAFNIAGTNSQILFDNNRIYNISQLNEGSYDGMIISTGASNIRVIKNIFRTEGAFKRPRYAMQIQSGVTSVVRFGNDFKVNAVTNSMLDNSTTPVTTVTDVV